MKNKFKKKQPPIRCFITKCWLPMIAITDKNDVISIYRECQRSFFFFKNKIKTYVITFLKMIPNKSWQWTSHICKKGIIHSSLSLWKHFSLCICVHYFFCCITVMSQFESISPIEFTRAQEAMVCHIMGHNPSEKETNLKKKRWTWKSSDRGLLD